MQSKQKNPVRNIRQFGTAASKEDMNLLRDIAEDYAKVKNYVYQRYSGVRSVGKLHPGYTVQNEMTHCPLRKELGLPTVYFYPAIFDALADIKSCWTKHRKEIIRQANRNKNFSEEELHYVCSMIRNDRHFASILLGEELVFGQDGRLAQIKPERRKSLNNYIRRQVRKRPIMLEVRKKTSFRVNVKGYLYDKGTLRLTTKVSRKRVVVSLTDKNQYNTRLEITLVPESLRMIINVPIYTKVRSHADYNNQIGLALGYGILFTSSSGNCYGGEYGIRRTKQIEWLDGIKQQRHRLERMRDSYMEQGDTTKARNIENNNLGTAKITKTKHKMDAEIKCYINSEIDRMLSTEKPAIIYLPHYAAPATIAGYTVKGVNRKLSLWQKGYAQERLAFKCEINNIKICRISSKGSSSLCSECGVMGKVNNNEFYCGSCGLHISSKVNTARNILKFGQNANGNG